MKPHPAIHPAMPHVMSAPGYIFQPSGLLLREIERWMNTQLGGDWCTSHSGSKDEHWIDFELEKDLIYFKLRWVG